MSELRPYQTQAIADLRASLHKGHRSPLFVLPTGGGKTAIAAEMIRNARNKGGTAAFLAPRRELIYQTAERLESQRIDYGVIMAGEDPSLLPAVQVACIPTLHARAIQRERIRLPKADLVLVDEAHIGVGGQAQSIIEQYRNQGSVIVGLTATPARSDGRGLGMIYDDLVQGPSVRELTDQGYLVPSRYFGGSKPDLEGVKVQAGDYNKRQLGKRTDDPVLIGDVVQNWARLASDRQTFVFAVNVAHSRHLAEQFRAYGIAAEHIDGTTENDERKAIQKRLRTGETQVIVNCEVMTYGVDFPPVSCIVLACPTKSITKLMQMVGRGLRTSEGKRDCFVIDHAGAVDELGFVDDPMPWSLDGKERIQDRKEKEAKEPKEIECGDCGATFRAAKRCPNCGEEMGSKYSKAIEAHEAELVEIERNRKRKESGEWSITEKARFHAELKDIARARGYKEGWAARKYRERLGVWPNDPRIKQVDPLEPSVETQRWVQHTQIKWAKSKQGAAA